MLDNRQIAPYFPPAYYLAMAGLAFRQRVKAAMADQEVSVAELSRRSRVPYHTLDKFLKRENATTSAENAAAIANALGIPAGDDGEYDELRKLFFELSEEQQKFVLASVRGLLGR
jgi:lambda repressor-like predicted transcriptional regulator